MPRYSLTISEISNEEALSILLHAKTLEAADASAAEFPEFPESRTPGDAVVVRPTKKGRPATLPASSAPTANPAMLPTAPVAPTFAPAPVLVPLPAPAPAPPFLVAPEPVTLDALTVQARALAGGALRQFALLAVLNAMGVPQINKVPVERYAAFDALLAAAIAYSALPGATLDGLKAACQMGQYETATTMLQNAVTQAI